MSAWRRAFARALAAFAASAVMAALAPWPAFAHGMLLRLENAGATVAGVAYYTNGATAAGEYVELVDLDAPGAPPVGTTTDEAGRFRFDGRAGGRYRLVAHGDEGHRTELEFTLGAAEAPRLVDDDGPASAGGLGELPAWAVLGGLLLLVTVPVLVRRLSRSGRASAASRGP